MLTNLQNVCHRAGGIKDKVFENFLKSLKTCEGMELVPECLERLTQSCFLKFLL